MEGVTILTDEEARYARRNILTSDRLVVLATSSCISKDLRAVIEDELKMRIKEGRSV